MPRDAHDKRAVSPVIGVILLVAITVILAATIAGFAMGMNPGSDDIQAGVTIDVEPTTNTIMVDVITLGNADHVTVTGDPVGNLKSSGSLVDSDLEALGVGYTLEIEQDDLETDAESGQVSVVGVSDGNERVIVSETYDVSL